MVGTAKHNVRENWPMASYIHSWQLFRQLSDENKETAEALLSEKQWPHRDGLRIVDIGCGDGKLLRQVLVRMDSSKHQVVLLDPDDDLLADSQREVEGLRGINVDGIESVNACLAEALPDVLNGADLILAVHVVYLMEHGDFQKLITSLPVNVPLYVVLDKPGSVFSTLWEKFARGFLRRVHQTHDFIGSLDRSEYEVASCVVTSRLEDPLVNPNEDVQIALISLLCYDEARDMTVEAFAMAKETLQQFARAGLIRCDSMCYEIVRH